MHLPTRFKLVDVTESRIWPNPVRRRCGNRSGKRRINIALSNKVGDPHVVKADKGGNVLGQLVFNLHPGQVNRRRLKIWRYLPDGLLSCGYDAGYARNIWKCV